MPCPFQIFSQSDHLIPIVDINSHNEWQPVQIQISLLLRQGIFGFSRTRVNISKYILVHDQWISQNYWPAIKSSGFQRLPFIVSSCDKTHFHISELKIWLYTYTKPLISNLTKYAYIISSPSSIRHIIPRTFT